MPTQRSSPRDFAMMSEENDISETSKSANRSWRQNSSEGCSRVGIRSIPSGLTRPSNTAHVRGFDAMAMLSCRFMSMADCRAEVADSLP